MGIYLDTNVWNRPFDTPSPRILQEVDAFFGILEKVFEGKLVIISSVILDVEISQMADLEKKQATEQLIDLFAADKVSTLSHSKAQEIREITDLTLPDATHLACAITAGCKYFITCDDEVIQKRITIESHYGLKVFNPVEFLAQGEATW